ETRDNTALADRIRHKYRLKNTVGYALNSLVDFDDGIEILKHLMIGSEGTLGFISSITYDTVPDEAHKAATLAIFPTMGEACRATAALKALTGTPVAAVELMDRAALRSVEDTPGMETTLQGLPDGAAALLIDVRGEDAATLETRMKAAHEALAGSNTVTPVVFTTDLETYALYWKIRKGMFPAVGAVRETGTTVVIEDVAFAMEDLEAGVTELIDMLGRHGYDNAILFGHALEGNLHFVFPQGFDDPAEVARYQGMMDELAQLVAGRFGGSLKGEHGTGRNMAPFVELEWGHEAYELMWTVKRLFDPEGFLSPEVLLSRNDTIHLENLKPLPAADPLVDRCIECGFCEPVCPSRDLTLTPRQRIVVRREIARLEETGEDAERLKALWDGYAYDGIETCAATGLCALPCPVGINTGELVRKLRREAAGEGGTLPQLAADHFAGLTATARGVLRVANGMHRAVGTTNMGRITGIARRLSGNRLPQWLPSMPGAARVRSLRRAADSAAADADTVVYLPACATRMFGASRQEPDSRSTMDLTLAVLEKAGYRVVIPDGIEHSCCGMMFASKGQAAAAERKATELEATLWSATEGGRYPVICDTSPCTQQMQSSLTAPLTIHEPVGFLHDHALARLAITPKREPVAVHVTCSSTRMGLSDKFLAVARACCEEVVVPPDIHCCGFAGDKGFNTPELNASALNGLAEQVAGCVAGYSNSRTCEIGLTQHAGIPYRSILALVDEVSTVAAPAAATG
ncbi:MAG: FAD-linked oxidase C-terminal domain-containing protein, partial [Ectothiorhodospiraceae bacterium]